MENLGNLVGFALFAWVVLAVVLKAFRGKPKNREPRPVKCGSCGMIYDRSVFPHCNRCGELRLWARR